MRVIVVRAVTILVNFETLETCVRHVCEQCKPFIVLRISISVFVKESLKIYLDYYRCEYEKVCTTTRQQYAGKTVEKWVRIIKIAYNKSYNIISLRTRIRVVFHAIRTKRDGPSSNIILLGIVIILTLWRIQGRGDGVIAPPPPLDCVFYVILMF